MQILHVVGARPNFMKLAPVLKALTRRAAVRQQVIHTGQHYDASMSDVFFQQLDIPEPDVNLAVGSGTHAQQTAQIMQRFEPVVLERWPDWVLVYGDVNSTVAAALVCAKLGVRVAHVEAGLRSFDRTMPEEINRLVTDQLADLLLTPSQDANDNLLREGVTPEKIRLVGNVMIDTLVELLPKAEQRLPASLPECYVLVTLHRPSNVDEPERLRALYDTLLWTSERADVLFPVHPRTRRRFEEFGLATGSNGRLRLLDPLPYLEFLALQTRAAMVVTDSGGIQEETTYLGIPCLTVRENTERPITVTLGTNTVVGADMGRLRLEMERVLNGRSRRGSIPPLWDGQTGERIADVLESALGCPPG